MNQNWVYFVSTIVGVALSYGVNQLPSVPESWKPWLPIPVVGLTVVSGWLMTQQGSRSRTTITGNRLAGDRSKIRAVDAEVKDNEMTGADTEITTDGTSGSGRNP
jgi:hypothetical protein